MLFLNFRPNISHCNPRGVKYYTTLSEIQEKNVLALIIKDKAAFLTSLIELNKSHRPLIEEELHALYVLNYKEYYKDPQNAPYHLDLYNDVFHHAIVSFIKFADLTYTK